MPHKIATERTEYMRAWTARRTAQRKTDYLCPGCGVPLDPGDKQCPSCRNKRRKRESERRSKRANSGLCLVCGMVPPAGRSSVCAECSDRKKKRGRDLKEERKRRGLCLRCAGDVRAEVGKNYCRECLDKFSRATNTRRNLFLSQGLCGNCGQAPLATADRCLTCSRAATARRHGLAPAEYTALIAAGCRICGNTDRLHIDHDHLCCHGKNGSCGKCVRGALCPLHNTLVGFVEHPDVPEVVKYLAETGSTALNLLFLAVHDLGVPDPFSRRR